MEGMISELFNVDAGFECLHGGYPFGEHKKARRSGWKGGHGWTVTRDKASD